MKAQIIIFGAKKRGLKLKMVDSKNLVLGKEDEYLSNSKSKSIFFMAC